MSREWNRSGVMQEFIKIAAKSGLITSDLQQKELAGNADKKTPVKDHRRYEPTEEYELKVDGGNLVEKAHPGKARMDENSTPVRSMGDGSLVENIEQQQKKDIEIATRMPSGALVGVHASIVSDLVKLADYLDSNGRTKEAARVDATIERLSRRPFANGQIQKKAWVWPLVSILTMVAPYVFNRLFNKGVTTRIKGTPTNRTVTKGPAGMGSKGKLMTAIGLGLSGLVFFGKKILSLQESILEDTKDLYKVLQEAAKKSNAARTAAIRLEPYLKEFEKKPTTPAEYESYKKKFVEFKGILTSIKTDIKNAKDLGEISNWSWLLSSRIDSNIETLESHFSEIENKGKKLDNMAAQNITKTPTVSGGVLGLQQVLLSRGLLSKDKMIGEMNSETIAAAEQLENNLEDKTNQLYEKKLITSKPSEGWKGKIIKDGKMVISPEKLARIVHLVDLYMKKLK